MKRAISVPHSGEADVLQPWKKLNETTLLEAFSDTIRLSLLGRDFILNKSAGREEGLTFGTASVSESVKMSHRLSRNETGQERFLAA